MTAKQICELFGCSESSLKTNFARTAASLKKKYNVDVIRCEKDGQKYYQIFEDTRALTIYNEINDIPISIESLSFEAYEFFVFLALAASSQGVYRGRREDLLKYVGIKPTKKNIETLYNSLLNVDYFGRNEIIKVLNLSPAGASKLISNLLDLQVTIPVLGHGKGKYCFNIIGVNYEQRHKKIY